MVSFSEFSVSNYPEWITGLSLLSMEQKSSSNMQRAKKSELKKQIGISMVKTSPWSLLTLLPVI